MSVPCEMLLHPELLTNQQLICIIQERYLHFTNIEMMLRDQLLDIFHNYCVPFGQRKYRDSGRGKVLNKARHLSPERPTKLNTIIHQQMTSSQHRKQSHSNCDRLKPPPDLLSGHMKRIKIENKVSSLDKSIIINSKRKMSIDSNTYTTDSPPTKKEKKAITWP